MLEGVIDCDKLGIVPDIPAELGRLQKQNAALTQSNRLLKGTLIILGLGFSICVISKIIHHERKEKQARQA
ncbi:MAG: hypothetical protein AAF934_12005 [Bacteroidota bacterium]